MAKTYEAIATQTLSSSAATVTFSSITGTYTDLVLVGSVYGTTNDVGLNMQFNGDTGNNYSGTLLRGTGSTAYSNRQSNINFINLFGYTYGTGSTNGIYAPVNCSINNYSNSTTYKTTLTRSFDQRNDGGGEVYANVGLWRSTSAITSISLALTSGNIATDSTFTLYGIKAA